MTTKWKQPKVVRMLGAAVVATLMVFTGLAPAGADEPDISCKRDAGTNITLREGCGKKTSSNPIQGLRASRYSSTAGEIMWDRNSDATGYQITRNGTFLGSKDVTSWYMDDLREGQSYTFKVTAYYRDGTIAFRNVYMSRSTQNQRYS